MVNAYQKRLNAPGPSSSSSRFGFLGRGRSEYLARWVSNQSLDWSIVFRDQLFTFVIARLACPAMSCFIVALHSIVLKGENGNVEHADFRIGANVFFNQSAVGFEFPQTATA